MIEENTLFIVFQVVWQSLQNDRAYSSMKSNEEVIDTLVKEIHNNQKIAYELALILENILFSSQKQIVNSCRDEIIKNSTFVQYRGAKIYKPAENDKSIRLLDHKIKDLDKYLKLNSRKKNNYSVPDFIANLSDSQHKLFVASNESTHQLLQILEHDCDVSIYKSALRDNENGICKQMLSKFLTEIERNKKLDSIFDAQTYLTINQIFTKFKGKPA